MSIVYQVLKIKDIQTKNLKKFNRYQVTNRVWYKEDNQLALKDDYFIEQWDDAKKEQVIYDLQRCVNNGGFVIGALEDHSIIGFVNVEEELFGVNKEYRELAYIHVSNEFRGKGIGKRLFNLCCEKAIRIGTKKLYIAAHPSEETQHFYRSVGCVEAEEINQKIVEREPLDIQLEFALY